jgi:hypothetical protein
MKRSRASPWRSRLTIRAEGGPARSGIGLGLTVGGAGGAGQARKQEIAIASAVAMAARAAQSGPRRLAAEQQRSSECCFADRDPTPLDGIGGQREAFGRLAGEPGEQGIGGEPAGFAERDRGRVRGAGEQNGDEGTQGPYGGP